MITLHFGLHYEYFRNTSALIIPANLIIDKDYKKQYLTHSNIL